MSDIERLREIAAKATPGPWRKSLFEGDDGTPHIGDFGWTVYGCPAGETEDSEQGRADADYIAEADPSTVLALLDRLEAAEAAVERVRALADECDRRTTREPDRVLTFWARRLRAALDADAAEATGGGA